MNMRNGKLDLEILETLTLRVGPILAEQYAGWRHQSIASARRGLARLVLAGLATVETHSVRDFVSVDGPLLECRPGDPEPDYGHWAYVARNRYRGVRTRRVSVYFASPRCCRAFGVRHSKSKAHQINHDLGVTACFLSLIRGDKTICNSWRHEHLYEAANPPGRKIPDAFLVDPRTNEPIKGIDFLGPTYSAKRLRELSRELLETRKIPFAFY